MSTDGVGLIAMGNKQSVAEHPNSLISCASKAGYQGLSGNPPPSLPRTGRCQTSAVDAHYGRPSRMLVGGHDWKNSMNGPADVKHSPSGTRSGRLAAGTRLAGLVRTHGGTRKAEYNGTKGSHPGNASAARHVHGLRVPYLLW